MNELKVNDFAVFFEAIHAHPPFPWQTMLVHRVAEQGWPEGIDLPTASGKTACIDAAVFLLAMGAAAARRRIFFVVDRRIVVDEAYRRAERLAVKLENATEGVVKQVADLLRALAGLGPNDDPLVVSRLRGGLLKDERWRSSPAQAAVVTGTVDQVGSRLLFRSYGSSPLAAPIDAALTACDSLILLDEAHCAVPFMQTARAVSRYADRPWVGGGTGDGERSGRQMIAPPLTLSILSATLPKEATDVFPGSAREAALDHELLHRRRQTAKPAELVKPVKDRDALAKQFVKRATDLAHDQPRRIAVMVNRVATAAEVARSLGEQVEGRKAKLNADVVLLTGRMRPFDRDQLVNQWSPKLKAGSEEPLERPIILVTTQCLEVGADFSFDVLLTECASLDALRQRFGRVNRLGDPQVEVDAAVLVAKPDVAAKADDPIYGEALKKTWQWLTDNVDDETFDFGIEAVDGKLPADAEALSELNAPSPDAPVMLPAHVDFFCQTSPRPTPDPDAAVFLHGPREAAPEAQLVFRADLPDPAASDDWPATWPEAVGLLPPVSSEALTLPLHVLRRWLAGTVSEQAVAALGDVEGQAGEQEEERGRGQPQPFVIWRGRRNSTASTDPRQVQPGDLVVVRADAECAGALGAAFCKPAEVPLDIAEQVYPQARGRHVLRLVPGLDDLAAEEYAPADLSAMTRLTSWAIEDDREPATFDESLEELLSEIAAQEEPRREELRWLTIAAAQLRKQHRSEPHPAGGLLLLGAPTTGQFVSADLDGDADDALSAAEEPVPLDEHTRDVVRQARASAGSCLAPELAEAVGLAAELHDLGKADPRFQELLHGDALTAAVEMANGRIVAKSAGARRSPRPQQQIASAAGLPKGFRHEMLSMQLVEAAADRLPTATDLRELVLHLIASHHGHARPFAPVVVDEKQPTARVDGIELTQAQRERLTPPHRLDSGVAERFWRLTRRHGWWGLAYLEATLRLADHAASAAEATAASEPSLETSP